MMRSPLPVLPRDDLFHYLGEAFDSHPLIVLSAAMGYGKTTLANDIKQRLGACCVSFTPAKAMADASAVWAALTECVSQASEEVAAIMKNMEVPDIRGELPPELVEAFRRESGKRALLILVDDYHLIDLPEISFFFEGLIKERISGVRVLLLTRRLPSIALAELVMKGLALVLHSNFLAFSMLNTQHFFSLCGLNAPWEAERAWARCEGWPAGIWMLANSHLAKNEHVFPLMPEHFFSASFMSSFSMEETHFLSLLSLLESFSASQAAYVAKNEDAPRMLESLFERNAFLFYAPESETFRLHRLFKERLAGMLEQLISAPDADIDIAGLYTRSAECLMENGFILPAVTLLSRTGNDEDKLRVLQLIQRPNEMLDEAFENAELVALIADIPWDIRYRSPLGYLSMLNSVMVRIGGRENRELLSEAEARFDSYHAYDEEMKKQLRGEIEIIRASADYNVLEDMFGHYVRADSLLGGKPSGILSPHMHWPYDSIHMAMAYLREPGSYGRLVKEVQKNLPIYQKLSNGSSKNQHYLFHAEYLLETGSTNDVDYLLQKACYANPHEDDLFLLLGAGFIKARLNAAKGDMESAWSVLEDLRPVILEQGRPRLACILDMSQAYIASILNRAEKIPEFIYKIGISSFPIVPFSHGFKYVAVGKALLAMKEWAMLEVLIEKAEAHNALYKSVLADIHILCLKSCVKKNQSMGMLASTYLERALELARPDGIITCIAEYGPHLHATHQQMLGMLPNDRQLVILGKQLRKYGRLRKKTTYTSREEEVLEVLRMGLSNRQIAERLNISVGSVANVLTHIYDKMGVANRAEALTVMRENS